MRDNADVTGTELYDFLALFAGLSRCLGGGLVLAAMMAAPATAKECPAWDQPPLSVAEQWAVVARGLSEYQVKVTNARPNPRFCLDLIAELKRRGTTMIVPPSVVAQSPDAPAIGAALGRCAGKTATPWGDLWGYWQGHGGASPEEIPPEAYPNLFDRVDATANFTLTPARMDGKDAVVTDAAGWCIRDKGIFHVGERHAVDLRTCKTVLMDTSSRPGYNMMIEYKNKHYVIDTSIWDKTNPTTWSIFVYEISNKENASFCLIDLPTRK